MKKGKGYINPDGTGGVGSIKFGNNLRANANANVRSGAGKIASNLYAPVTRAGRNKLYMTKAEAVKYMSYTNSGNAGAGMGGKIVKNIAKGAVATGIIGAYLSLNDTANKYDELKKKIKMDRATLQSLKKSRRGQTRGR